MERLQGGGKNDNFLSSRIITTNMSEFNIFDDTSLSIPRKNIISDRQLETSAEKDDGVVEVSSPINSGNSP